MAKIAQRKKRYCWAVASTLYSASSCWYVWLQPQPVGKRASSCVYNFLTHTLWLPGRSPTRSQKATDGSAESQRQWARNKSPTEMCYKNLGTMSCGIRESQHRPIWRVASRTTQIILDDVPNLSTFPFVSLPFKYPTQRSSPVGSLVHVLYVHRTTDFTWAPIAWCDSALDEAKGYEVLNI